MTSPVISGIISDVLLDLGDETASVYSSGKVQQTIFKLLPLFNGLIGGPCFSGSNIEGTISPEISGTVYLGLLQLLVEKELTKSTLYAAARSYNLTSFQEGDSKVTTSDASKTLGELYARLDKEFMIMLNQVKYSIVSAAPASIVGGDAGIDALGGLYNGYRAFPEKT